jgi:hypothetical protein
LNTYAPPLRAQSLRAARGAVLEPRGAAREARPTAGLRIRPFRHAYNRTVAKRSSGASESVVRTRSRPALVLHNDRQSLLCFGCRPVPPQMIRREVVTVMDVEEVAGHGHSGLWCQWLSTPHKGTVCSCRGSIGVARLREPALREAALWVPLHARSRLCSVGPSWTQCPQPMDPVNSSRRPDNRGGSSRPSLTSG